MPTGVHTLMKTPFLELSLVTLLAVAGQGAARAGGDAPPPATDPLQGVEWVVEVIADTGIVDDSRVTLVFGAEGKVAGSGSCNRYFGPYTLAADKVTFGNMASTMMACPEALMEQERRFLQTLQQVQSFEITADGALVLRSGDVTILARRAVVP